MLDNLGHALLGSSTAGLLIEHQVDDSISDQAPVLHGSLGKVGNGNLVHLGQGEVDAKSLFVERQSLGSEVDREAAVLDVLARRSIHTYRDPEISRLHVVELADNKGNEVVTLDWTFVSEATSMLLKHVRFSSAMSVTVNLAFRAGSSKQGNALRASVASIWVLARMPSVPSDLLYVER
ncbi:hypothetical protein Trco_001701 [Trichoderma cornu-damae]|uniref:Uncharacterized protein n=1 Tax=Trichoderma cornu-damae TaxID=654480 RepID=A0A9P8QRF1_9HYPO|nr:hypothetical protein Trco_001701 [Trichoderma cornu-damae]